MSDRQNGSTTPAGSPIIDTTVAHQGRVYDYLAGGNAHCHDPSGNGIELISYEAE